MNRAHLITRRAGFALGIATMVLAGFLGVPIQARASLLTAPSFAGNTQPMISAGGNTTQGFINFAVYNTAGGTLTDSYGTGNALMNAALTAAGMSTTSSFLYLFQDVNIPPGKDIASSSVRVDGATVTSTGFLAGLTFAGVTAATPFLGPSAATATDISPAVTGATVADATPAGGVVVSPTTVAPNAAVGATAVLATYVPALGSIGLLRISSLWGYTSSRSPSFRIGSIQDGGIAANGTVPANFGVNVTAVPEPSSLAIVGLGGLGMIGYGLRRRKALGA